MRFWLFLFSVFWPFCAHAAQTDWQTVAPDVRMRLVSADTRTGGKTLVGLEIDMPATTKTYWRLPGETGLPTQIDLAGSRGIAAHTVFWPFPKRSQTGGYTDYVYHGATVLPVELTLSEPTADLVAQVTLGICSDICMPVSARFALPLAFAKADMAQSLRLKQAQAQTPIAWTNAPEPVGAVWFNAAANALAVEVDPGQIDPNSLIAASADGALLFGAPQKSLKPNLVLLPLLGAAKKKSLESQTVQLTFTTSMGAFELSRHLAFAP